MMNYDEMDHHDEHQWINGLVKYRQFPEISYIFSIYVLYIYMCPIFHGKKAMDSGEEFPFNQSISPVLPTFRSWSTSKKS